MLGFTLSKLNLLIFVIAIFSIVSYFLFSFQASATAKIALDLVKGYSSDAYSIITSESLCDSKEIFLPRTLSVDPYSRGGDFFVLKVSSFDLEEETTKIVFSIAKRKSPEEIITASSIDVSGTVYLFSYDPERGAENAMQLEQSSASFDPQAFPPINKILFIKEVIDGKNHIFFIPCSTESIAGCLPFRNNAMNELQQNLSEIFGLLGSSQRETEESERGETGGFKC